MEHKRQAGLLLSVTALPGKYGIGDFGDCSYRFIDRLAKTGFALWQILPLNPLGYGNSPYQPFSSFAIDEQFADLDALVEEGLVKKVEMPSVIEGKVHYDNVRAFKHGYLLEAYETFLKQADAQQKLDEFVKENPWVKDWSVFMMFKRRYPSSWNEWPKEIAEWIATRPALNQQDTYDARFEIFAQMLLYAQWQKVHAYAKEKGIAIIGDVPFYVGFDSVDVWANQDSFLLDEETHLPSCVAGVPPDYFSATGQRWGNPIYDWKKLEANEFAFVANRIYLNSKLYDIIRLDHFRAFDTYWKIPAKCETAIDGAWIEAPGYAFFDLLLKKYPGINIIAEDLGDLRPEVLQLRDHYDFPGMNVIQFTFEDCELAHKGDWNRENSVAYLDTHDNDTMLSYFYLLPKQAQGDWLFTLTKLGIPEGTPVQRMMMYCLRKPARMAILSMQDILELDVIARTNVPGVVDDRNWTWRMNDFAAFDAKLPWLEEQIKASNR